MKNYILSDLSQQKKFFPLSYTRAIADFRVGISTIKEKWDFFLDKRSSIKTEDYLQAKYKLEITDNNIVINSAVIPNRILCNVISNLNNETLIKDGVIIAFSCNKEISLPEKTIEYQENITILKHITDIFSLNEECIINDFEAITHNRESSKLSSTNTVFGANEIFIGENCNIECCTFNTTDGPIYIGDNVTIMEGSHIRGAFAACDNSIIKMGAKIYGATTIGPKCKVGGEIKNVVFFAHSNKSHDGYIGNSIVGEWCNFGADTNISNLKNNYVTVKLWDYEKEKFVDTGLQFCGLIMGDHSKCGINTMFNSGTVVGVSTNIFGSGYPRNFIPSFSFGGHDGITELKLKPALETMTRVMERDNVKLSDIDKGIFEQIFNQTSKYRR